MGKSNIGYHSLRLNLDNEQHRRVQKILLNLNTSVYKSVNQFLIDAADDYIRKLEGEELTREEEHRKPEKPTYVTQKDLDDIRREIKMELKDDIIHVLGKALAGGQVRPMKDITQETTSVERNETDAAMTGLVSNWG